MHEVFNVRAKFGSGRYTRFAAYKRG